MKKFLALILSLAMVFALVACGDEKTDDSQGDTSVDAITSSTLSFSVKAVQEAVADCIAQAKA